MMSKVKSKMRIGALSNKVSMRIFWFDIQLKEIRR